MDTQFIPYDRSEEPRPTRVDRRHFSSIGTQNLSLRNRFELDRPHSSYCDGNHKARNRVGSSSMSASGNHSKQQTRRVNEVDTDELVKHMSNLPSYLERSVKPQEKAFNVGVLDWGLLEKWQSSKQVSFRSEGSSSSNSVASSLFSTKESTYSQTGNSSGASHHRHCQFPSETSTSDVKSRNFSRKQLGSTAESNLKGLSSNSTGSSSKSVNQRGNDPSFSSKEQHHNDLEKQVRRSRRSQSMSYNHESTENDEKHVLVRPLDDWSTPLATKGPKAKISQRKLKEKDLNSTEKYRKAHNVELSCHIKHSCPLPSDVDDQKIRVLRSCMSQDTKSSDKETAADSQPYDEDDEKIRFLRSCMSQNTTKSNDRGTAAGSQPSNTGKLISSLNDRSFEDNRRVIIELPTVAGVPQGSRISKPPVEAANGRHPSPTGRFSFRIGSRKSSSTEDAELMQNCCVHAIDKPYTKGEVNSFPIEKSSCDKYAAAGKARSSPLKRLIEPLLKPREATNKLPSASLKKDSKPLHSATKMPDRPSTAPGIRVGLNLNSDNTTTIPQNMKNNETAVNQAILQVVVQNGSPLFTFAVDSVEDIFCAAFSKLGCDKTYGDRYLYTFFSIHEIKSRSWMNLRAKGSGHGYCPSVVALMEVSESQFTRSTNNNFLRQFVLSSVDLNSGEKSEYQINDELAALVVSHRDKMHLDKYNGTTVILPSGIHTLPSKGKPSSLIERWRSGGQCDCGGWDPGCKLRFLTDSNCQPTSSIEFKLYEEGGVEGKQQPMFSMAPLKDKEGALSVSFSSSISPLQGFSICLAILDSRKLLRPPTPVKVQEAKGSDQTSRDEVPGSYFSVPPHSPVGRV